ncbi:MAG: hypothetical protein R2698_07725 [Microthrixaceae bacterium]
MNAPQDTWSEDDTVLLYTCKTIDALRFGGDLPPLIPVPFRLQSGTNGVLDEVYLQGAFQTLIFKPYREPDRSGRSLFTKFLYYTTPAWILGEKLKDLLKKASYDGWAPAMGGQLFYSNYGAYLLQQGDRIPSFISWNAIQAAHLEDQGVLEITTVGAAGQETHFRVITDWAELMFLTWACLYMPHHPQLTTLGWIPADFEAKLRARGWYETSGLARIRSNFARGIVRPQELTSTWTDAAPATPGVPAEPSSLVESGGPVWDPETQSWR